jgi:membrane-bound inhibitor of C-type lysozyme
MMMKSSQFLIPLLALAACAPPDARPPSEQKTVAMAGVRYVCEDGRALNALYPDREMAQLKLGDATHLLRITRSASGARYVGDALQWWTKGDTATLAPLKPGEDVASAPGVKCGPPADRAGDDAVGGN